MIGRSRDGLGRSRQAGPRAGKRGADASHPDAATELEHSFPSVVASHVLRPTPASHTRAPTPHAASASFTRFTLKPAPQLPAPGPLALGSRNLLVPPPTSAARTPPGRTRVRSVSGASNSTSGGGGVARPQAAQKLYHETVLIHRDHATLPEEPKVGRRADRSERRLGARASEDRRGRGAASRVAVAAAAEKEGRACVTSGTRRAACRPGPTGMRCKEFFVDFFSPSKLKVVHFERERTFQRFVVQSVAGIEKPYH